ncbi:unnamed protein product [Parnassius mnemosyne]|uniref:Uncharacterized protein n=2 Tax=Parnassius mnemosyne TaxID=213953 RepID=A0AAV1M5L0_9NEOP
MYSYCTSVEVQQNEDLPKTVCESCYELLIKLFDFKQTCIKSQNTLLECKKSVKTENNVFITVEVDSHIVASEDEYGNEFEMSNVKAEQAEVGPCNNYEFASDKKEIGNTNELQIKDELSCDNSTKKKISKRLKKLATPNLLVVKSVSKINLSTSKKPKIFSCQLCKKNFSFRERFEAHKLEHEGKEAPIYCAPCDKTFMTWSGLWRHNESEHTRVSLGSLKCRICGKTSKNKHTLRMHEKSHAKRSPCVCDICGKTFVSTTVLKAHLETHEENRERRYECDQCDKKFFSNTVLLSHISKCHRGRRFICQICTFSFSEKSNLVRHLRLHEGKKLFKCDLCEKSYVASSSLIEHKRMHSGERPFSCIYCPKTFSAKKRLNDHHRIHTGEKPHRCGVCSQSFTQRGTLNRHMKVHGKFSLALN